MGKLKRQCMGRLRDNISFWEQMTDNEYILNILKIGYHIPFTKLPGEVELPNNSSALNNANFVTEEIERLLTKGCITHSLLKPTVVNPLTVADDKNKKR